MQSISRLFLLWSFACFTVTAQTLYRYKNNMKHVLGDAKQAIIQNKLSSTSQVNNLLDGFETLGFSGIRIPIFASDSLVPNLSIYNSLYNEARKRGFKVFANPAQHAGGQRVANGIIAEVGPKPLNNDEATQTLIARIQEYAKDYKCDWINPFNEDGAPGGAWSANQMNEIYETLENTINGADLIGPGAWGIPASIRVLQNTNVGKYVSIATSHNLGFNHASWATFIDEANDLGLEVWDSEVNNARKNGGTSRLEAAIEAKVNGLVVYNAWTFVNLSNGNISNTGQVFKDKYMQYYEFENVGGDVLAVPSSDTSGSRLVGESLSSDGTETMWEAVPPKITDYASNKIRFRNRKTGHFMRPETNNNFTGVETRSSCSGSCLHVQWILRNGGGGSVFLDNVGSKTRLNYNNKVQMAPTHWTGDFSKWKLNKVG